MSEKTSDVNQRQVTIGGYVVVPGSRKERQAANREAKKMAMLQEENEQLKAAAKGMEGTAERVADKGVADGQSTHLSRDIAQARDEVNKLNSTGQFCKELWPGFEDLLAAAEAKLQAAQAAKRAANPLKQQLENAQAFHARAKKKVDEAILQREECKTELEVLAESLREHDRRVAEVEAKRLEANQQVAELTRQWAEQAGQSDSSDCGIIDGSSAKAVTLGSQEVSLIRYLFKMVPEDNLKEACSSHGIGADEIVARTEAVISKIEAQANSVTPMGHRPPGTHEAAAALSTEAAQLRASGSGEPWQEVQKLWADFDVGMLSDDESVAPSEAGEGPDAPRKRKAETTAKYAKIKKAHQTFGEKLRVGASKFGK